MFILILDKCIVLSKELGKLIMQLTEFFCTIKQTFLFFLCVFILPKLLGIIGNHPGVSVIRKLVYIKQILSTISAH